MGDGAQEMVVADCVIQSMLALQHLFRMTKFLGSSFLTHPVYWVGVLFLVFCFLAGLSV